MAKQGKRRSSTLTDMRWNYRYEGFSIFAVLFLINFLNYLERYFLAGAANGIAKELHFGIAGIGVLASAYLICVFGGAIPLGMWADRGKRTWVIALCVGIWSLAAMGTGLAWGGWGAVRFSDDRGHWRDRL